MRRLRPKTQVFFGDGKRHARESVPEKTMSHAEYESEIRSSEAESENIQALRDLFTCRDSVDAWHHERMLQTCLQ